MKPESLPQRKKRPSGTWLDPGVAEVNAVPTKKMRGTWIEADQGRNVGGEWEVKTRRLFVTVSDGDVYISRSDHLSSPTLIEMSVADLLRALADGGEYA